MGHTKSKGIPKNIYFFTDYAKAFDYVDHNKLWKILKVMRIQDHLSCLEKLYAGQEATVRILHGRTEQLKIEKGVYCHPAYLTYMRVYHAKCKAG